MPALIGDGRPPLFLSALCLLLSGGFAVLQAWTGQFLPHDTAFLRMSAHQLCEINECRIVHFMVHDRVSFGGALIAIAVLYLWLIEFPLRSGEAWSWWTLATSGIVGFGSFLTYLGYGYLDTWHGVATLLLLPCFSIGLWRTRGLLTSSASPVRPAWLQRLRPTPWSTWWSTPGLGRACLVMACIGTIGAGSTIMTIGATTVFVPTDLTYMGLTRSDFDAINPRLVPLIAHDRAGFGGAVTTCGLLALAMVWYARPLRSLFHALWIAGIVGWGAAIGIHPVIGYNDSMHLAPAVTGSVLFFLGLWVVQGTMSWKPGSWRSQAVLSDAQS